MHSPKFHVLDIVSVTKSRPGEPWGTVTEVRRYADGQFRYSVAPLDPDEIGTIFDENDLIPTGRKANIADFTMIGDLHNGEVVKIRDTSELTEIVGKLGTVIGGTPDGELIAVLLEEIGHVWSVPRADIETTWSRVIQPRAKRTPSLRVSQDGNILGADEYEVIEEIYDL